MSIIAHFPAPPGADLARTDTVDLSAALAELRDDRPRMAYELLGAGRTQAEAAAILGVDEAEVLELYVDHVALKMGNLRQVGMRMTRSYNLTEVARAWLSLPVADLAAEYQIHIETAEEMQTAARAMRAERGGAQTECQHGTGPGPCDTCPADEQWPATGGAR